MSCVFRVPIVKGNFITFNGQKPHRTVISDGSVDLLGPFELKMAKGVRAPESAGPEPVRSLFFLDLTSTPLTGSVEGVQQRRELNEEAGNEKIISGQAYYGISYDKGVTNDITKHVLAYNITGLPRCTDNCNISVALSTSQKCTKETHDGASFVPLLDKLTYTTDIQGNTGVKRQSFNVDGEHPTGEQLVALLKNVQENPTQAQELNLSTFFYDEEGELVACSFLQPTTSDEMKDLANRILGLDGSMIGDADAEAEINSTTPVAATDGGSSAGGTSLLSSLAFGLSTACVLFNV